MKLTQIPQFDDLVKHQIVSTPNGRFYGVGEHVPCDHCVVFEYPDCFRTFDGRAWAVVGKKPEGRE